MSNQKKPYLRAMSKFHRYSFGNALLILFQCSTATRVAGYSTWKKEFGRNVKPHEKASKSLPHVPPGNMSGKKLLTPIPERSCATRMEAPKRKRSLL